MYTLTIVFHKDRSMVLVCDHAKLGCVNFVGGRVQPHENPYDASYRELEEETGITRNDIQLALVRQETVVKLKDAWEMVVTAGVLKHDVELRPEKNKLRWVGIYDYYEFLGDGFDDTLTYLLEAERMFGIRKTKPPVGY